MSLAFAILPSYHSAWRDGWTCGCGEHLLQEAVQHLHDLRDIRDTRKDVLQAGHTTAQSGVADGANRANWSPRRQQHLTLADSAGQWKTGISGGCCRPPFSAGPEPAGGAESKPPMCSACASSDVRTASKAVLLAEHKGPPTLSAAGGVVGSRGRQICPPTAAQAIAPAPASDDDDCWGVEGPCRPGAGCSKRSGGRRRRPSN